MTYKGINWTKRRTIRIIKCTWWISSWAYPTRRQNHCHVSASYSDCCSICWSNSIISIIFFIILNINPLSRIHSILPILSKSLSYKIYTWCLIYSYTRTYWSIWCIWCLYRSSHKIRESSSCPLNCELRCNFVYTFWS